MSIGYRTARSQPRRPAAQVCWRVQPVDPRGCDRLSSGRLPTAGHRWSAPCEPPNDITTHRVGGPSLSHPFEASVWTVDNYDAGADRRDGLANAFLNSLTVAIPSTLIPILIAAFAAYAFAWMKFPGRKGCLSWSSPCWWCPCRSPSCRS